MQKGVKILITILIIVATFLAICTGFFFAKSNSLQKKSDENTKNISEAKVTEPSVAETTTKIAAKPQEVPTSVVSVSSSDTRPSSPADVVVVGAGETLFEIGQKVGVSYILIAEANGIDANKLKVGESLMIPKNNQISFVINKDKAANLQKDVDGGKNSFRLSTTDTAKADSPSAYGLLSTDSFVKDKVDITAGSATVMAKKGDKTYLITLVQPTTKGEKGIWAIESIKLQAK